MNASRLLEHFDRISEAPNAIPKLRKFILDLAVRGKLVEQDPGDEPAAALLVRIRAEKARLAKDKATKKSKPVSPTAIDEIPFTIPATWTWSQLGEVGIINPRNAAPDSEATSFVPMKMIPAEFGADAAHEVRPWGEIKSGFTHFSDGDVALAKITPCFENGKSTVFKALTGGIGAGTTELHVVRPVLVFAEYLLVFLKSPYFIETGVPKMTGTAGQKRVSTEYFSQAPLPLPPLAEQRRIVAKVDELMWLCDRLEAVRAEREARRDRLVGAAIGHLDSGTLDTGWQVYDRLPSLIESPKHISRFRQTLINLAVSGRLSRRGGSDEPAATLCNRLQLESARQEATGIQRKRPPSLLLPPSDQPFEVPNGWEWRRVRDIGVTQTGTTPPSSNPEFFGDYIPFVKPADLSSRSIDYSGRGISRDGVAHSRLVKGPAVMMVCIGASIGKVNMTDRDVCCNQQINAVTPYVDGMSGFMALALRASYFQQLVIASAGTTTLPIISKGKWELLPVPVPPFEEQQRIVAQVDELMTLCDRLEGQLTAAQTDSGLLLNAVVHEALSAVG